MLESLVERKVMLHYTNTAPHSHHLLCIIFSMPIIFSLLLLAAHAQSGGGVDQTGTNGNHTIQGRIFFPSGRRADMRIKVKLESANSGDLSIFTDSNGSFTFRSLSPGSYTITIDAGNNYEIAVERVYIDVEPSIRSSISIGSAMSRSYTLSIQLKPKTTTQQEMNSSVINAALSDVPKDAIELYQQARKSAAESDHKKAVDLLRRAIAIHSDFALAHSELGVQYLKLGQLDDAVLTLRTAVKLAPESFAARLNLGIVCLEKKDFSEAEAQLQRASRLNDTSLTTLMYLGITQAKLRKYKDAEGNLKRAIDLSNGKMGMAHYYLAGVYWAQQNNARAADELEAYLQSTPNATDAERVRNTIKNLRGKH